MGMTNGQFKSHTRLVIGDLEEIEESLKNKNYDFAEAKLDKLRSNLQAALED